MKSLESNMKEINGNYLEMLKNLNRVLDISIEVIENSEIDCSKDGESVIIEDVINRLEVIVKEESIFTIARFQPAATNLRKLIMYLNSSRLLERMGDLLKINLKMIRKIKTDSKIMTGYLQEYLLPIVIKTSEIYKNYITAFENKDETLLYSLIIKDDEISVMSDNYTDKIIELMKESTDDIESGVSLIRLFKKYERFSDHTVHLVSDLIYIIKGENLRKIELEEKLRLESE